MPTRVSQACVFCGKVFSCSQNYRGNKFCCGEQTCMQKKPVKGKQKRKPLIQLPDNGCGGSPLPSPGASGGGSPPPSPGGGGGGPPQQHAAGLKDLPPELCAVILDYLEHGNDGRVDSESLRAVLRATAMSDKNENGSAGGVGLNDMQKETQRRICALWHQGRFQDEYVAPYCSHYLGPLYSYRS